jgi:hypothetical protein
MSLRSPVRLADEGLMDAAGFHLHLALYWRLLAADWRRFARRHR